MLVKAVKLYVYFISLLCRLAVELGVSGSPLDHAWSSLEIG